MQLVTRRRLRQVAQLVLLTAAVAATAQAAPDNDADPRAEAGELFNAPPLRFTHLEKNVIREYYGLRRSWRPPEPQQRKFQAPSSEKRATAGALLPSSARKQFLPGSLEGRLSLLPSGYERWIVGKDVVLLNRRTNIVTDIVPNAVN